MKLPICVDGRIDSARANVYADELLGMTIRERLQHHAVKDAEDGNRAANAEGEKILAHSYRPPEVGSDGDSSW